MNFLSVQDVGTVLPTPLEKTEASVMDISDNSVPNDNIRLKVLDESVSLN
jgi:hypothetical protein